jgi:hypothetical protein
MAFERRLLLDQETQSSDSATRRIPLPRGGILSGLELRIRITNGATSGLEKVFEQFPKELMALFAGDVASFFSPEGFLRAQLFYLFVPLLFIVFTAAFGSGAIAHLLEQRRRARGLPPAVRMELPNDPRVRDLRVRPHRLEDYDALGRSEDSDS